MEFLTVGQMLDKIKVGDVAIPIECMSGNINDNLKFCEDAVCIDEKDYILKTVHGVKVNGFCKMPNVIQDKFIIVSREQYGNLLTRL